MLVADSCAAVAPICPNWFLRIKRIKRLVFGHAWKMSMSSSEIQLKTNRTIRFICN
jgi:hypothetical protein